MRKIIIDTETTGVSVEDKIIEIAAVEIFEFAPTGNIFHKYINPGRKISEMAFKVHGIKDEFLIDKPKFHDISEHFLDFIGDASLIIHNAVFDIRFLNQELSAIGKPNIKNSVIDTLLLARNKFPGQQNDIDSLCDRFKINRKQRTLHGALTDVMLLHEIYVELFGGKQRKFSFQNNHSISKNNSYKLKVIKATTEERSLHQQMLKNIQDAIWNNQTF